MLKICRRVVLGQRHRFGGQPADHPDQVLERQGHGVPGSGQGTGRHARVRGLFRFLDQNAAAAPLHRSAAAGRIVERAAQHHGHHARAAVQRGAAEQRVGGGPDPILARPPRQPDRAIDDEDVMVGRRHVHPAVHQLFAVHGELGRQRAGTVENARQRLAAGRRDVQHRHDGGRKVGRQPRQEGAERHQPSGRGPNDDDVLTWMARHIVDYYIAHRRHRPGARPAPVLADLPSWSGEPRSVEPGQSKTMVLFSWTMTRSSRCQATARASTDRSTCRPSFRSPSTVQR